MTPTDVAEQVATELARTVTAADAGRRVALAVPGGSVADLLFPRFARLAVDWSRVDVTWVDERAVPPDHPDSNVRVARHLWLDRLAAPGPRIIAPPFSLDADRMAADWQAALIGALGVPPRLDVALLGVGSDGHVASIFPLDPSLDRQDVWVIGVHDAPKPPPDRVTLTRATLAQSSELWVVAFGREKAAAIREARADPHASSPLAQVIAAAPHVRWFLDDAAASA
jgi:6-phosphogluconolactonase